MTKGSKILLGIAAAVSAGVAIIYLLKTEKGSEIGKQVKDIAGDFFEKSKEVISKVKDEAAGRVKERIV